MTIKTFLSDYWAHSSAGVLAIWNIYLHVKSNKTEKKKDLKVAYLELTSKINEFQVSCLEIILLENDIVDLQFGVDQRVDEANKIIAEITELNSKETTKRSTDLIESVARLKAEFADIVDPELKREKQKELKLKVQEIEDYVQEIENNRIIKETKIAEVNKIKNHLTDNISKFDEGITKKLITLPKITNEFVNQLYSISNWQLIASDRVSGSVKELTKACREFNTMFLNLQSKQIKMNEIISTTEFGKIWQLCGETIDKMKAEI